MTWINVGPRSRAAAGFLGAKGLQTAPQAFGVAFLGPSEANVPGTFAKDVRSLGAFHDQLADEAPGSSRECVVNQDVFARHLALSATLWVHERR